ncbi:MAG: hypothetical protein Q7S40_04020 [Opitutaceae bacterium]|nr:hypothetical protein [Opitutaceae bacterium]
MKPSKPQSRDAGFSDYELLKWQVRVAQRADELREKTSGPTKDDRETWLRAEAEVLGRLPDQPRAGDSG